MGAIYAAAGDHFPGSLGQGQTAQSVRVPEILAEGNVGGSAVNGPTSQPAPARRGRRAPLADQQLVSN